MGVKIPAKTGDVKPAPETEKPDQTTTDQKQLKKPKYERIRKNKQSNQTEGGIFKKKLKTQIINKRLKNLNSSTRTARR